MLYTIIKELLPKFEEKLEKYIKKLGKYGSCEYTKSEPYICLNENSPKYEYEVVDVELTASYKVGDYQFVASLEWIDEAEENLIKKVSEDVYVPEIYRTRRECDHCNTKRYRKSTVILKSNIDGSYIQVGKSCVKDYIGVDLGNYASYLSFFSNIEEYLEECEKDNLGSIRPMYKVQYILEQAAEEILHHGYISKKSSWELETDSTSQRVYMMVTGSVNYYEQRSYQEYKVISDKAKENIDELRNYYAEIEDEDDFIHNIKVLLPLEYVGVDKIGILVAGFGIKLRRDAAQKEKEERVTSEFVGNLGDRITFTAVPECIFSSESDYGWFYIYRLKSGSNEFIWKTSKELRTDIEIEFTGTIKAHEEYRGVKQTEITRARTKAIL